MDPSTVALVTLHTVASVISVNSTLKHVQPGQEMTECLKLDDSKEDTLKRGVSAKGSMKRSHTHTHTHTPVIAFINSTWSFGEQI